MVTKENYIDMEIRLNKLLSDAGLCSRREADKFIEMGRVTVNGKLPEIGQKVTKTDIVMLDEVKVDFKQAQEHTRTGAGKTQNLIFGDTITATEKKEKKSSETVAPVEGSKPAGSRKPLRPGKYVKYNKYAAARKVVKNGDNTKKELPPQEKALKEAMQPKFGKSLSKAAVAQRLAASSKSASLRKTSKNNPINKAKRAAARNKPKGE